MCVHVHVLLCVSRLCLCMYMYCMYMYSHKFIYQFIRACSSPGLLTRHLQHFNALLSQHVIQFHSLCSNFCFLLLSDSNLVGHIVEDKNGIHNFHSVCVRMRIKSMI